MSQTGPVRGAEHARLALVALIAASVLAVAAADAAATFPGRNGKISYVGSGSGKATFAIYTVNPDGSGLHSFPPTENCGGDLGSSFSADGRRFLFQSGCAGTEDIWVMNADGTRRKRLTHESLQHVGPSFFPNGRTIIFLRSGNGNSAIYLMNADGSNQRPFPHDLHGFAPQVSPDGRKIVYLRASATKLGERNVWIMNADGTHQRRLGSDFAGDPSFSPAGHRITYTREAVGGNPNRSDIYAMSTDGTHRRRLTHNPWQDSEPVFSPDGREMVFTSTRGHGYLSIWVMNADATHPRRLAVSGEVPGWQPLPSCGDPDRDGPARPAEGEGSSGAHRGCEPPEREDR